MALTARYDEQILKPALLLAEDVTLRSWRLDAREAVGTELWATTMPVPFVGELTAALKKGNVVRLESLGIDDKLREKLYARALSLHLLDDEKKDPGWRESLFEFFHDPLVQEVSEAAWSMSKETLMRWVPQRLNRL